MKFTDIKEFVSLGLSATGNYPKLPTIAPGPASDVQLQKLSPGPIVFLSVGDGRGFTTELAYDQPFIRVRAIGDQSQYDYAERLAYDIDTILCRVDTNTLIGAATALYITRSGGGPALLEYDSSSRYHFTCTYITEIESGI